MVPKMRMEKNKIEKISRLSTVLGTITVALLAVLFSSKLYAADSIKGSQIYTVNCSICHGATGRSMMPGAPSFDRGEGVLKPDFTLLAAIRSGKNAMPAFRGMLSDRDIMDVIAYLRTLH